MPDGADLATIAVKRCYEGLQSGTAAVSVQDAVAAIRLAWQIERDETIPARDEALAELAKVQEAMLTLKDAIIRRSGQDEWRALAGEVQKERERAREIRKARQALRAIFPGEQPIAARRTEGRRSCRRHREPHAGRALAQFLSHSPLYGTVRHRSPGHHRAKSRAVTAACGCRPADLESVLAQLEGR